MAPSSQWFMSIAGKITRLGKVIDPIDAGLNMVRKSVTKLTIRQITLERGCQALRMQE
jgi:hypothetical protein